MKRSAAPLVAGLLAGLCSVTACLSTPDEPDDLTLREAPIGSKGGVLQLSLAWEGPEAGPDPIPWRPITVTFIDPYDPSAIFTKQAVPDKGLVTLDDIPPGSYRLAVHSPGYLAMVSAGLYELQPESELFADLTTPGATIGEQLCANENLSAMRAGDLDRDGRIDTTDLAILQSPDAPPWADFDDDGDLDGQDAAWILSNLDREVPEPSQIFEVSVPSGPCALASVGLGESYPECLTLDWSPDLVDCDLLCSEQTESTCTDVCGEGLTCADVMCPACGLCSSAFLGCRQACRGVHPFG